MDDFPASKMHRTSCVFKNCKTLWIQAKLVKGSDITVAWLVTSPPLVQTQRSVDFAETQQKGKISDLGFSQKLKTKWLTGSSGFIIRVQQVPLRPQDDRHGHISQILTKNIEDQHSTLSFAPVLRIPWCYPVWIYHCMGKFKLIYLSKYIDCLLHTFSVGASSQWL